MISARAGYEDLFPGDCSKWKVEAFKDIKKKFDDVFEFNDRAEPLPVTELHVVEAEWLPRTALPVAFAPRLADDPA